MKLKVIAVGGVPGTGKSTLMKQFMERYGGKDWQFKTDTKLVPYYNITRTYVLGSYPEGEVFGGTDKMSMAVQPEAIKFLASLPNDSVVIFEGDRLFNSSFLSHCFDKYDLRIIVLEANETERNRRYEQRGSNQDPTWLQGRISKVKNIQGNLEFFDCRETFKHEYPEDTEKVVSRMLGIINE